MKKSLIALAALAAVASAQADVTVYGTLDPSVIIQKLPTTTGNATAYATSSAMDQSSQLGFKGSEDIGGGLKVIFDLQGDLTLGNGLMGNSNSGNSGAATATVGGNASAANAVTAPQADVFNRNAYVGLVGSAGTVKIGRQFTPFHENQVNNDAFGMNSGGFLAALSQLTTTGTSTTSGSNFMINTKSMISAFGNSNVGVNSYGSYANGISYELPTTNGLTVKVMQTFGETALTAANANTGLPSSSSGISSIKAVWDVNPSLKLNAAYQTTRAGVAPQPAVGSAGGSGCDPTTAVGVYDCAVGTAAVKSAGANVYTGTTAITAQNAISGTVTPGQQVFSVNQYGAQYTMGQFRFTLSQFNLQQFVTGFDNVSLTHTGVLYAYSPVLDLGLEYTAVKDKSVTANTANTTAALARYKLSKTTYVWALYDTTANAGTSVMNGNYSGVAASAGPAAGGTVSSFSSGIRYAF